MSADIYEQQHTFEKRLIAGPFDNFEQFQYAQLPIKWNWHLEEGFIGHGEMTQDDPTVKISLNWEMDMIPMEPPTPDEPIKVLTFESTEDPLQAEQRYAQEMVHLLAALHLLSLENQTKNK